MPGSTLTVGTLQDGTEVSYETGGEEDTGRTNFFGRSITRDVPYTYTLDHPDGSTDTIEVETNDYHKPQRPMSEMVSHFDAEYGWDELTAEAYIATYGTNRDTLGWPESPNGHPFVGLIKHYPISDSSVGNIVALYHVNGHLEPYIRKRREGAVDDAHDTPENTEAIPLPDSELKDELTFEVPDDGDLSDLIRTLASDGVWCTTGFPYEINDRRTTTGTQIDVADQFKDELDYPAYWTDSGGKKYEIIL